MWYYFSVYIYIHIYIYINIYKGTKVWTGRVDMLLWITLSTQRSILIQLYLIITCFISLKYLHVKIRYGAYSHDIHKCHVLPSPLLFIIWYWTVWPWEKYWEKKTWTWSNGAAYIWKYEGGLYSSSLCNEISISHILFWPIKFHLVLWMSITLQTIVYGAHM